MGRRRRRRGGLSLTGILVIGAVLYFTGAGAWLWNRTKELPSACYGLLNQVGTSMGQSGCDMLARGLNSVGDGTTGVMDRLKDRVGGGAGNAVSDMGEYADGLLSRVSGGNGSLSDFTSSGSRLREMMDQQPIVLPSIANAGERLRMSLDQFVIGQHYLQGAQTAKALPWLQRSAEQPGGYGVLSQLTLGDMYRNGGYGVNANTNVSRQYYEAAYRSINELQTNGGGEARQLLGSLPAQPDQLKVQLEQQLQRMK